MRFRDFFKKHKLSSSNAEKNVSSPVSGNIPSTNDATIYSQYSDMPRYFTINGTAYDIDVPYDIVNLPLITCVIMVHGEKYGMDTILLEHGTQAREANEQIYQAAMDKVSEYRHRGIIHKSKQEIEWNKEYYARQEEKKALEAKRKAQCNAFTIDDMQQFTGIPFGWNWVMELSHTNGVAWFMLNMNNQKVAMHYISQIAAFIEDAHSYVEGIDDVYIDLSKIDFGYPIPMTPDSMACTRVECYPYTNTGRISKYPAILSFSTSESYTGEDGLAHQVHPVCGEIKLMHDGNIGWAKVYFIQNRKISVRFGLYGISLVIKRIDCDDDCFRTLYEFDNG